MEKGAMWAFGWEKTERRFSRNASWGGLTDQRAKKPPGWRWAARFCKSLGLIKRGVLFGEEVAWGVVDV